MAKLNPEELQNVKALLQNGASSVIPTHNTLTLYTADRPEQITFNRDQVRFLHALQKGMTLEEAAAYAHWTLDQANRFLTSDKLKRVQENHAYCDGISAYWQSIGNWMAEGHRNYRDVLSKGQDRLAFEYWKEFGDRVAPKPTRPDAYRNPVVQININPDLVHKAIERQHAIEAEVLHANA